MKTTVFTVKGVGTFPFDMLRYDYCYPASTTDAVSIENYDREIRGPRTITLKTNHSNMSGMIVLAPDRWASFGWKVELIESV